jgi:6-phosphogluconate dehydrogenase
MEKADIGLIGLAVMGENLVLNMESKGFTVSVYNRTTSKVDDFLSGRGKAKSIVGAHTVEELVSSLKTPRKIMIMVKSGKPVDLLIQKITPHLDDGDIIIDGGNSNYTDTERRVKNLESSNLSYVGCGVSGGEEGALHGPSLMPGGSERAWPEIRHIYQTIAAKAPDGSPCCLWLGKGGAGHFVKMVHNGIEYGDMQLIGEAYHIMRNVLKLTNEETGGIFKSWNSGDLESYLIEITGDILHHRDENGSYTLDQILDTAGQKGTGKWTGITAMDMGIPLTLIGEAVFARCLSSQKEDRVETSKVFSTGEAGFSGSTQDFLADLKQALFASKIISYAQGFALLREASHVYNWELNLGNIALIWRAGCIIRSSFLDNIKDAFTGKTELRNLILDPYFNDKITSSIPGWRRVVSTAVLHEIPLPAMSSALSYFDGLKSERLPSNLLQAQRDYFGAHTYERVDKPRGEFFHTNWTGKGGITSSSTYTV